PNQWNDWMWQIKNRITAPAALKNIINLAENEEQDINHCLEKFRMAITPYFAMLINPENPECPVKKQCVPSLQELSFQPCDLTDPLSEEAYSPVEHIVHRYPDRVLFLLTRKCSMYCRHCMRRRLVGEEDFSINSESLNRALEYIAGNTAIRDVLLSGGDPLVMSDRQIEDIVSKVRAIPHVEIIRIGTRVPAVLPMRITAELLAMFKKYQPIWINTHFNHPVELTSASIEACAKIVDAGIPLGNQSVLLKGVNDDSAVLKELLTKLVKARIRPYYLYQCDLAKGIGHFRTPVEKGIEIMRKLRGYISGYAVPTFVIDAPNGGGKIPVGPEYLMDINPETVTLKNYKGDICTYPNVAY
ncbi:MAG: lysine 2,3-aminomutase, partial [Clostridiales bacterium]|nr:lysine 2,3-aminomutase [Clostridiales bacterium]